MSDQVFEIKEFALQTLPAYRRPIVEKLIISGVFGDFDLDDFDELACEILDVIVEQHLLDGHLRENLLPENHD